MASTSGSVESLRAAAGEATPLSKVRLQLAALIQTELARPGGWRSVVNASLPRYPAPSTVKLHRVRTTAQRTSTTSSVRKTDRTTSLKASEESFARPKMNAAETVARHLETATLWVTANMEHDEALRFLRSESTFRDLVRVGLAHMPLKAEPISFRVYQGAGWHSRCVGTAYAHVAANPDAADTNQVGICRISISYTLVAGGPPGNRDVAVFTFGRTLEDGVKVVKT